MWHVCVCLYCGVYIQCISGGVYTGVYVFYIHVYVCGGACSICGMCACVCIVVCIRCVYLVVCTRV